MIDLSPNSHSPRYNTAYQQTEFIKKKTPTQHKKPTHIKWEPTIIQFHASTEYPSKIFENSNNSHPEASVAKPPQSDRNPAWPIRYYYQLSTF